MSTDTLAQLTADLTTAMKARDADRVSVLRQVIGAVRAEAKAGTVEKELTEEDVLKVLTREVKKRRDSAQIYTDAGAPERAEVETREADAIETYLPARLSADELEALVRSVVADLGATSVKDMGAVMKEATARAAGAADGKALSTLVRATLQG
ncbi:GatB/YqeY domain-containing protein [Cellulomonas soli]